MFRALVLMTLRRPRQALAPSCQRTKWRRNERSQLSSHVSMNGHGKRAELIGFQGVRHAPENEMGVVLLFAKLHRTLGFPEIDIIQPQFPDCWATHRDGSGTRHTWIEFEFASHSFKHHVRAVRKLKPRKGFIVCWYHDLPECEKFGRVIELRTHVGAGWRVWSQATLPEYQGDLDRAPRRDRLAWDWSASMRARPGDLMLMWRAGTRAQAREYDVDPDRLQSFTNIFEVTSVPQRQRRFRAGAHVRQVARLDQPLRLELLTSDRMLRTAPWVKANLQGRPELTPYWWRLHELIIQLNPRLRRNRGFQRFDPTRM